MPTDESHRPRLPDAVRALVAEAHRETVAAHGDLGLDLVAFEERVVSNAVRQLAAGEPPDGDDPAAAHVRRAALADVCLAVAADRGSDRAWTALSDGWRTRLEGFAVRRGASSADAVAIVQDLFGDLAMPPSDGRARTLLGTFDGTGSLFGWLSIVLLRRLAGRARGRKTQSLDALEPAEREAASPPRVAVPSDPREDAEHREGIARFERALASAWATLSDQERLALLFKHRDGLTQRQAGHLLGVGEARVSRVVTAALDKLRHAARATFSDDGGAALSPDAWRALEAVVSRHLARNPADPHPSPGGGRPSAPPPRVGPAPTGPGREAPTLMNTPDDPIEAWIGRGPPAPAPDACPDDNRLAGYAEGRLPAAARPALEAHLSRCEACRGLVAAYRAGAEGAEEVGGRGEEEAPVAHAAAPDPAPIPSLAAARARAVRIWALAAAVALFALGAGFAIRAWLPASPPSFDAFDATIAAAAADLRAAEPSLLADLRPLTATERAGGVADTTRSGVRILEPAGTVLSPRPPVSWEAVPGATLYVVTFSDAKTGAAIASTKTQATRLGPWVGKELLVPGGAYLVEVAASGDLGSQKASLAFQVATADVARDFAAAVAVIERKARPGEKALLVASLAVRMNLLLEAERVLSTAAARGPTDPTSAAPAREALLELRAHVRRRLSWPEAPSGR